MVEWKQGTVNEDGYYDYDYRYYHEPGYYQDNDDDDDDDNDDDDDDDEGDDNNDYYDDNDDDDNDDDDDDDDDDTLYIERFADFNDMDETIHAIITDDNVCNGKSGYEFVLERYHALEFLSVGNNCFNKTVRFSLSYLPSLFRISIGEDSFNFNPSDGGNTILSFMITSCNALESVFINKQSFTFFNSFNLDTCCSLRSLTIGHVNQDSNNFTYADFILNSALLQLSNISVGDGCFSKGTRCVLGGMTVCVWL